MINVVNIALQQLSDEGRESCLSSAKMAFISGTEFQTTAKRYARYVYYGTSRRTPAVALTPKACNNAACGAGFGAPQHLTLACAFIVSVSGPKKPKKQRRLGGPWAAGPLLRHDLGAPGGGAAFAGLRGGSAEHTACG